MESKNEPKQFEIAEIEISYKPILKASERAKITCSKDAFEILKTCWNQNEIDLVEHFRILLLSNGNKVIGSRLISTGGTSNTVADPKLIFGIALKAAASAIILAHNHPSGILAPSEPDLIQTRKLEEAGKLLDLPIIDHLIISSEGYYSFADEGLL